jgi:hypothetical protein
VSLGALDRGKHELVGRYGGALGVGVSVCGWHLASS